METKAAIAFANIFMAKIENQILQQSKHKPLEWVRSIDDITSFWDVPIDELKQFIEEANRFHPTVKFTASISYTKATFLDTTIYKGNCFKQQGILDGRPSGTSLMVCYGPSRHLFIYVNSYCIPLYYFNILVQTCAEQGCFVFV